MLRIRLFECALERVWGAIWLRQPTYSMVNAPVTTPLVLERNSLIDPRLTDEEVMHRSQMSDFRIPRDSTLEFWKKNSATRDG